MPRIVLVGAGSVEFTRNLLGDILTSPALRDSHIALHDIDPDRLATAERMARWTADCAGRRADDLAPTSTGARRSPARTSSINTIQVGGARATQVDFDVPARFGLRYTIADTIGVGGVFRGAPDDPGRPRHRPRHGGHLPRRLAPQLHEPAGDRSSGRCRRRATSGSSGSATPSSGRSTGSRSYLGPGARRGRRRERRPEPPRVRPPPRAPRPRPLSGPAGVRRGRQGPRTTTSSGPTCSGGSATTRRNRPSTTREYNPWYIGKKDAAGDAVERFHVPIGEYLDRVSRQPRRVRRDEAEARRRRAVRDRAERRVRGDDRGVDDDRRAGPDRRQRDQRRRADPEPRGGRLRRGPRPRRRPRRPPGRDGHLCRCTSRRTSAARSTCRA